MQILSNKYFLCLLLLVALQLHGKTQKLDKELLYTIIDQNKRVLGLEDSTLNNETKRIRIINLSSCHYVDEDSITIIDPVMGKNTIGHYGVYAIFYTSENKIQPDLNSGNYRDLFILSCKKGEEEKEEITTLVYAFNLRSGMRQNPIKGDLIFTITDGKRKLESAHFGLVSGD